MDDSAGVLGIDGRSCFNLDTVLEDDAVFEEEAKMGCLGGSGNLASSGRAMKHQHKHYNCHVRVPSTDPSPW